MQKGMSESGSLIGMNSCRFGVCFGFDFLVYKSHICALCVLLQQSDFCRSSTVVVVVAEV